MGHAVLHVKSIHDVIPFYRDVLGFRLSDYMTRPFNAYFFHANPRHHSVAFIETGRNATHHLMMELFNLDDVGQCYDLALGEEGRIGVTLGRHINDEVTSFYSNTPSGFMVEYGWGGRVIDVDNWQPEEVTWGPSMWGHDRMWMPPEGRVEARKLRISAAGGGLRKPVNVIEGNHERMAGVCPWWDQRAQRRSGGIAETALDARGTPKSRTAGFRGPGNDPITSAVARVVGPFRRGATMRITDHRSGNDVCCADGAIRRRPGHYRRPANLPQHAIGLSMCQLPDHGPVRERKAAHDDFPCVDRSQVEGTVGQGSGSNSNSLPPTADQRRSAAGRSAARRAPRPAPRPSEARALSSPPCWPPRRGAAFGAEDQSLTLNVLSGPLARHRPGRPARQQEAVAGSPARGSGTNATPRSSRIRNRRACCRCRPAAARSSSQTCPGSVTGFIRLLMNSPSSLDGSHLSFSRFQVGVVDHPAVRRRMDVLELADVAVERDIRQLELVGNAGAAR